MSLLDRLEKRFGALGIPHLTEILILGQLAVYIAARSGHLQLENIALVPALVLAGEYRRLLSFLFIPPASNAFFLFFAWYLFYIMGVALEREWGEFRYTLFVFVGYAATVAASFLSPFEAVTNSFLGGSVFLAFAQLYPDFELYFFFILPVKMKWLAWLTWALYAWTLIAGSASDRLMTLAAVANLALFFGRDLFRTVRATGRRAAFEARAVAQEAEPLHRCEACGATEKSRPDLEFRYCSECGGCYCSEHLKAHGHGEAGGK